MLSCGGVYYSSCEGAGTVRVVRVGEQGKKRGLVECTGGFHHSKVLQKPYARKKMF